MGFLVGLKAKLIAGAAVLLALLAAVGRIFYAGKQAERAKQDRQALENRRTRDEVEDDVAGTGDDDARRRLREWSDGDRM